MRLHSFRKLSHLVARLAQLGLVLILLAVALGVLPAAVARAETIWPCDIDELINAINEANGNGEPDTITLDAGCTYVFSSAYAPDPDGYGPTALPPITSDITIKGNGATITRTGVNIFRFFYVTDTGSLALEDLTLANGLAQGGNGGDAAGCGGGGAAGFGGAIFNRGALTLSSVTLTDNTAQGGNGGYDPGGGWGGAGGGGMGGNGQSSTGNPGVNGGGIYGGVGGAAGVSGGNATGPGGGGGGAGAGSASAHGGNAGFGGGGGAGNGTPGSQGGNGGFGGGGGGYQTASVNAGFGGGNGGQWNGGGGAGMGGAIFNDAGTVTIHKSTLTGNTARGGSAGYATTGTPKGVDGSGYGGALFNHNGTVSVVNTTIANNILGTGTGPNPGTLAGGGIYNYQSTGVATLTLVNTVLADTPTPNTDCTNNGGTVTGPASNRNLIESHVGCGTPYSTGDPQLGTLADNGGETWTMAIPATSPALDAVPVVSCTLTTDQRDFTRPQLAACDIGAYEAESLFLDKIADPAPLVSPGEILTYTLVFSNNTLLDVTDVLITDAVSSEFTNPGFVSNAGATITPTGVISFAWEVEDLSPGEWGVITLTGVVSTDLASVLTFSNTVESYGLLGGNAQYNSSSAAVTTHGADLSVRKTVDNPTPNEGDTITYNVTVFNNGPDDTTGVVISDSLPVGVTFVSSDTTQGGYDSDTYLWAVGNLSVTDKAVLTLTAQVDLGTAGQVITNTAVISASDEPDDVTGNNEANAVIRVTDSDLAMSKTVDDDAPDEGQTIVYTVTVTNNGPDAATNVVVSDTLPSGVTYDSDDGGGAYNSGTGAWNAGNLGIGISTTLRITTTVDPGTAGTTITNTAVVSDADQGDTVPGNNQADATITVTEIDLEMAKDVDIVLREPGDTVVYTLQVTNNGPDDASGVVVSDTLPTGVTYSSDDGVGAYTSGTGVWSVPGTLGLGVSASLRITATVDAGTEGTTITNTAVITDSDQADTTPGNDQDDAPIVVPLTTDAELAMSKAVDDTTPDEGQSIIYALRVTNNGPSDATGVVVSDTLPSGVTYSSDDGGGAYDSGTGVWTAGSVTADNSITLQITVTVDAGTAGTTITNTATITEANENDPIAGNEEDDASITVTEIDLAMSKTVDDNTPDEGQVVVYTLQVTNNGPDDASGVVVSDTLPSGVTYSSDDGGGAYDSGAGVWDVPGTIGLGASATLRITVTVDAGTAGTTITNTATITDSDQVDTIAGNEEDDAAITVTEIDLAMSKTVDDNTPDEGQVVVYTLQATNNGPDDASGVVVSDTLPSGVTYSSDDGGGAYDSGAGVWNVPGTIGLGASATLRITATVDAGTAGTTITNTATITDSDQADTVPGNEEDDAAITVTEIDLAMSKVVDDSVPDEGQAVVYTLQVTNNGPDDATGVVVSDTLPSGVTYSSDDGVGAYDSGSGVWDVPGTIVLGASATLRITATVDAGTAGITITNTATITDSDQADTVPGNEEDDAAITVTDIDLAMSKTVDDSVPDEGQTIVYTVRVTNNGPDDATGVVVSDTLPSGVIYSLDDGAGTYSNTTGVWAAGSINAGNSVTLHITATVDAGTAGITITNTAAITDSDQADTAPGNDEDDAVITVAYTPVLTITKDGPFAANVGDIVVYTFTVSHDATSDGSPVSSVAVTDTVAGTAMLVSGDTDTDSELDLGETWIFTASYTIQPTDPDPLLNTGTVSGTDGEGDDVTADSNTHSTAVEYAPALSITKDGPLAANVGDTVVYTFTVSHDVASDGSPVSSVIVTDTIAGTATLVSGDINTDDKLDAGETWVLTASYTIQTTDPDPLVNIGTVSGQDEDGDDVPSAEDTHSTALGYAPFLTIVKDGPLAASVDDTVVYNFTVSHDVTSDGSPVSSVAVTDTVAGTAMLVSGDTDTDSELDVGETWIFTASYMVQPTDPDPLLNIGTVTGKDLDNSNVIANSNIHSLDVEYAPALTITKDGPVTAKLGDTAVYTFTVSHDVTSDGSPLSSVGVADTVAGTATLVSGDTDTDDELDAGETWVYIATYTIQPGDPDPLVNTGTVSGTDGDGDDVTADSNTHSTILEYVLTVNIVGDGSVTKDPDQPTYLYGDVVTLTAIADLGWTFAGWSGDLGGTLNLNTIFMDGDKVVTATFAQDQYTLTVNILGEGSVTKDPDQLTYVYGDVVTLTAIADPDWSFAGWSGDLSSTLNLDTILVDSDKVVTATFTAIAYTPTLTITKDGPAEARVGENVVYTFTVTHAPTSDGSPLHTISVTDSVAGPATLASGDDGNDELELGETWVFTASYRIQATDPSPLVNVGTVVAKDANGDDVSAQDTHSTAVGSLTYLPIVMRTYTGSMVR